MSSAIWLWASAFVVRLGFVSFRARDVAEPSEQDVTISATLCVLLKSRVKGYNQNTDGVIYSLIKLSIETAAYTSLFATVGGA